MTEETDRIDYKTLYEGARLDHQKLNAQIHILKSANAALTLTNGEIETEHKQLFKEVERLKQKYDAKVAECGKVFASYTKYRNAVVGLNRFIKIIKENMEIDNLEAQVRVMRTKSRLDSVEGVVETLDGMEEDE